MQFLEQKVLDVCGTSFQRKELMDRVLTFVSQNETEETRSPHVSPSRFLFFSFLAKISSKRTTTDEAIPAELGLYVASRFYLLFI